MGWFARIGQALAEAFRTNRRFLSMAFEDLPVERSVLASELRELVRRDIPILVHKRTKLSDGDEAARRRWFCDLEAFVSRSVRPHLSDTLAVWNDVVVVRTLDALVEVEQRHLATTPARIPVTCRFDSHWAN